MIKYRLICKDCNNNFDSWFSTSKEYERLKKKNFINCHACNSLRVEKTLMSPSVFVSKNNSKTINQSKKYKETRETILKYQEFIKKNFDYVGENFAYEARLIHYKDKKVSKGIYGSVSKKEFKELNEEGIKTQNIPWIKSGNN